MGPIRLPRLASIAAPHRSRGTRPGRATLGGDGAMSIKLARAAGCSPGGAASPPRALRPVDAGSVSGSGAPAPGPAISPTSGSRECGARCMEDRSPNLCCGCRADPRGARNGCPAPGLVTGADGHAKPARAKGAGRYGHFLPRCGARFARRCRVFGRVNLYCRFTGTVNARNRNGIGRKGATGVAARFGFEYWATRGSFDTGPSMGSDLARGR
jgi:hypothetical protein